jgi:GMP synthase (glutamine-hydrolysing)
MHEKILIIDFGSQYTQLIARRVRELNIYCEIIPFSKKPNLENVKGIIFSGSPFSVKDANSPQPEETFRKFELPTLGVCYGAQWIAEFHGGEVTSSKIREYGRAHLSGIEKTDVLVRGIEENSTVWMSHGDSVTQLPDDFTIVASTHDIPVAAFRHKEKDIFGLQFHPEVYHSTQGKEILKNFLVNVCRCSQDWTPESFVEETIEKLKHQIGNDKVVMALSGGVDSTVAATLISKAIGKNLYCIFVDNGLLRKDEFSKVIETYKDFGLNVKGVDAKNLFLGELKGVNDPEQKRKIIGRLFIDVFDQEAKALENVRWLGQGTIYPDVIESVSVNGPSVTIKSHHNVGGLPAKMNLSIVEPLRLLFKDEVRRVGKSLGIAEDFINRHPFPGPGLAIRILGDITEEKVRILQEADDIYINELKRSGLYDEVWQAGAIFLPVQSVGVMGDERTYENVICLRAVSSTDGMTADWSHLPYEFLGRVSNMIINRVKGINRVVFDISSKPPATIEWE